MTAPTAGRTPPTPGATPRVLARLRVGLLVLLLVVGIGGGWLLIASRDTLAQASVHASEYLRLTTISTRLLRADAEAGKAALAGDASAARHDRIASDLGQAASAVVEAAAAQPNQAADLAQVSSAAQSYGRALEAAWHQSDRQSAARALGEAEKDLQGTILPSTSTLAAANSRTADALLSQQYGWALPVASWLAVAALLAASWVVARRSRRIVNLGLAGALLAIGAVAVLSGSAVSAVTGSAVTARDGDFAQVKAATAAQNLLAHSHSLDVRGVLNRSVADQDESSAKLREANAALEMAGTPALRDALSAYLSAHQDLVTLAGRGDWDAATRLVTASAASSPSATVAAFDDAVGDALATSGAAVADAASGYSGSLLGQAIGVAVLAAAAAGLAAWGLGQRLKEYR